MERVGESCVMDTDPVGRLSSYLGFEHWSKINCNAMFLGAINSKCDFLASTYYANRSVEDIEKLFPQFQCTIIIHV